MNEFSKEELSLLHSMLALGARQLYEIPYFLLAPNVRDRAEALQSKLEEMIEESTPKNGQLIVTITGPSLSGKTTLIRKLVQTGKFQELVSHTTRRRRKGEVDGYDYYFVSKGVFEELDLIEMVTFNGNNYGLSSDEVLRGWASGKVPVVIVEPNGSQQINQIAAKRGWDVLSIFLETSEQTRIERFMERYRADELGKPSDYASRLMVMLQEEKNWSRSRDDYSVVYDDFSPATEDDVIQDIEARCIWPTESDLELLEEARAA